MTKSWVLKLGHDLKEKEWDFLENFEHRRIGLPPDKIVELPTYSDELMAKLIELGYLLPTRYGRYVHKSRSNFDDLS
jgi:hypothetical protein